MPKPSEYGQAHIYGADTFVADGLNDHLLFCFYAHFSPMVAFLIKQPYEIVRFRSTEV
jgi:hypothetical protein